MDAFEYDQRFARLVGQVDSADIRKGTELYEAASVRVIRIGKQEVVGTVSGGREGVYNTKLQFTAEKGLSGSCDCPSYFNCEHSYALARAVRDQLADRGKPGTHDRSTKINTREPELSSQEKELGKLWKMAERSGYILYPKDIYAFVEDREKLGVIQREPLRDLKKALIQEKPKDRSQFCSVLADYFEYKGIRVRDAWEQYFTAEKRESFENRFRRSEKRKDESHQWDRPALKLRPRIDFVDTKERGWLQASARWEIDGGGFSPDEISKLSDAKGALVKLGDRGWFRLDDSLTQSDQRLLGVLGLDPDRGNVQRLHATQVEDLFEETELGEAARAKIKNSIDSLSSIPQAAVPSKLDSLLRPYQKEGFIFLSRLSQLECGGILADDMGLGKTLQTLAWLLWLKQMSNDGFKCLVICPKSVMDNWVREPEKFSTGIRAQRFDSKKNEKGTAEIIVANYAQLRIHSDFFLSEAWDAIILDEAQFIKSPESQTTRIAHRLKAKHRIALTGTPIENSLVDLWSVMRFAMPRLLGPLAAFRQNYMRGEQHESLELLKKRLKPFFLRRLKTQVATELPERIEEDLYCDLEGTQRELYDGLLVETKTILSNRNQAGESANVLKALLRLRQVCCDPYLIEEGCDPGRPAKIDAALEIVDSIVAEGHKVLVFSQFVKLLDRVGDDLSAKRIGFLKLTGKTRDRQSLVDRFQKADTEQVFLLSLKAAGSGLTLTSASYVILLDPWWNPAVEAQAIDRVHRIGQKNQVIAYRILAKDTIEEKIRLLQQDKAALAAAVFGEGVAGSGIDLEEIKQILLD